MFCLVPCLKAALSKGLGIGIIAGSVMGMFLNFIFININELILYLHIFLLSSEIAPDS